MTLTITPEELRALLAAAADTAALTRIETLLNTFLNTFLNTLNTLTKENITMSQALDDKLTQLDAKEDAVIALLNADASEVAALQAAVNAQTDDSAEQAKAQALIDKLTAVLPAPAPVAPDPVLTGGGAAPAGGDTTGTAADGSGSVTGTGADSPVVADAADPTGPPPAMPGM